MVQRLVTLRGIIIPADWDDKGNVIATAIATDDEDEYLISGQKTTENYLDLLCKEVEVTGWFTKKGDKKILSIETYKKVSRYR
jgi:hypothetical protein